VGFYTNDTLKEWMLRRLSGFAGDMGWTVDSGEVNDALDATLADLQLSAAEDATDDRQLLGLARYYIWEVACEWFAIRPDTQLPDLVQESLRNLYSQARDQMQAAATKYNKSYAGLTIKQWPVQYPDDPFIKRSTTRVIW
jgi:hypothetical protein